MKSKKWSWKKNLHCMMALLDVEDESAETFGRACYGGLSPLYWRVPIFLWSLLVICWSSSGFWGPPEMFLLYMTHWGLLFIAVESLFGIIVAVRNYMGRLPDATGELPWYVKTYWVLYNITIPVAFLVTIFYWGVLKTANADREVKYAPDPVLDGMLHGANSLVMLTELLLSAHPSRLAHVMQPLYFAGAYMLFSVTYYLAGGLDPWGNAFIYPVIDWSKPEQTLVVITLTALFLALMHLIVVGLASLRDVIARRCLRNTTGVYNDGFGA